MTVIAFLNNFDQVYPSSMASSGSGGAGGAPGGGPDWLGLLKWSLKYQDGTAPTQHEPMNEEKRRFLEQVGFRLTSKRWVVNMQAMEETFVDIPRRIKEVLGELQELRVKADITEQDEERMQDLWEEIRDHTEQLDFALCFCQLNGLPTLFSYCFASEAPSDNKEEDFMVTPSCAALGVLATLTQNNPKVQVEVLKSGPIPSLARLVLEGTNNKLAAKALQALSCTIRGSPAAEQTFLQDFGQSVLGKAVESPDERLKQRGLFLLQALLGADHATKARGEDLLPLLPHVITSIEHEDVTINHNARMVVAEICNLVGTAQVMDQWGPQLLSMKAAREEYISDLRGVDLEEAREEVRFWKLVDDGGPFPRDGQVGPSGVTQQQPPSQQQEEAGEQGEEESTPVLLLEPPKLSAASNAP